MSLKTVIISHYNSPGQALISSKTIFFCKTCSGKGFKFVPGELSQLRPGDLTSISDTKTKDKLIYNESVIVILYDEIIFNINLTPLNIPQ